MMTKTPSQVTSCTRVSFVAEEGWLIVRLTYSLISHMGKRLKWIWMTLRMFVYVCLLSIPFWRAAFMFMVSDFIEKGVRYGDNPRNYLDIYHPTSHSLDNKSKSKKRTKTRKLFRSMNARRHSLEEYDSKINKKKYPVIIMACGGAWMIGYKGWSAFLGMCMAQLGIIVVSPDYRNYPQGTISDMLTDMNNAIQWTFDNIEKYGGDITRIFVCGQSAGAHIVTTLVLNKAKKINKLNNNNSNNNINLTLRNNEWLPKDLAGFISISGPYNLFDLKEHIHSRGLYIDVLDDIMENNIQKFSPFYILIKYFLKTNNNNINNKRLLRDLSSMSLLDESENTSDNTSDSSMSYNSNNTIISDINNIKVKLLLPPVFIFHGCNDRTVPVSEAENFAKLLQKYSENKIYLVKYSGKNHTAPLIEDPISGNDPLVTDILRIVYPNLQLNNIVEELEEMMRGYLNYPKFVINLASWVCPF